MLLVYVRFSSVYARICSALEERKNYVTLRSLNVMLDLKKFFKYVGHVLALIIRSTVLPIQLRAYAVQLY